MAAYWLFVVLMLATFTANLAAFLTVERMQTPVQSLDQLARQSRINYTVVNGSDTHVHFKNLKLAENSLYLLWRNLALSSTSNVAQYRYCLMVSIDVINFMSFLLQIVLKNDIVSKVSLLLTYDNLR